MIALIRRLVNDGMTPLNKLIGTSTDTGGGDRQQEH